MPGDSAEGEVKPLHPRAFGEGEKPCSGNYRVSWEAGQGLGAVGEEPGFQAEKVSERRLGW